MGWGSGYRGCCGKLKGGGDVLVCLFLVVVEGH